MLSALRAISRVLALGGSAALMLSGCSSTSQPTTPKSTLEFWNTAVMVVNKTSKCAWITVYWANSELSPWHIMDGDTTRPRFLEAGKGYNFAYTLVPAVSSLVGALQIKVLAEVMEGPGCTGKTIVSRYDWNKDMNPIGQDANVCSNVHEVGGSYYVAKPQLYKPQSGC